MIRIAVNTGRPYDVLIRRGLIKCAGEEIKKVISLKPLAVVTDSNVAPLYLHTLIDSLKESGFENTQSFTLPAGEKTKSLDSAQLMYQLLSSKKMTRDCCLIALGGGVIGDLCGFVASTYLRGIPFIQIPTTLLAQVDSSVGGKTAVNLASGKNLVGTFWQPSLVLCDPDTLSTLPGDVFADGMAETIKYGLIKDKDLFELLSHKKIDECLVQAIARCVEIKRDIVEKDERDTGERMILNFGHTMGHAIENWNQYTMRHGQCVAVGMAMILRSQVKAGMIKAEILEKYYKVCGKYNLPSLNSAPLEELFSICRQDKKNTAEYIRVVLLKDIGEGYIREFTFDEFEKFIREGNESEC